MTVEARVGFFPRGTAPRGIFALCKTTIDTASGRVVEGEPLTPDLMRTEVPASLEPGSDSLLDKRHTDVVVLGSAHASVPVSQMTVGVRIGSYGKRVQVFGDRIVHWRGRRARFSAPEPFTRIPVALDRAYGGVDARVPIDAAFDPTVADHPGLYPRNPYGRGYVVMREPVDGIALPNLEDPDDLMTPERLVVGDPARWWQQPIPASLGYLPPNVFNRYVYVGAQPWFPCPTDERLPEVRLGHLPPGFPRLWQTGPHRDFWQEASPGLRLPVAAGAPVEVRGMHPGDKPIRFRVPSPPHIEIDLEGRRQSPPPQLSKLVIEPEAQRAVLTWVVRTDRMHRIFLPRVHAEIPLAARIGETVVAYDTPPTVRSVLDAARAGGIDTTPPRPRPPRG